MSLRSESSARPAIATATASQARVRRGSLAALVLLVVQYGIGMYVNLYVTVPRADHGGGLGSAIVNGPAMLSSHAVLGLALAVVAIGVLVMAVIARHLGAIVSSALGLLALVSAAAAGASFTSSGDAGASMGMAVLTGVALLCYAVNLCAAPARPARVSRERVSARSTAVAGRLGPGLVPPRRAAVNDG